MEREPLLIETLLQRRISRSGNVYSFRPTVGPPAVGGQKIDKFLHDANQRFDISPILKGDQQQAKQVALDYFSFIKREAASAGLKEDEVMKRLQGSMSHLKRSLLTFYSYLDARVKGS